MRVPTYDKKQGRMKTPRVWLICPVCGKRFSLNYAEYMRNVRAGTWPTDSGKCGQSLRRLKEVTAAGIGVVTLTAIPVVKA